MAEIKDPKRFYYAMRSKYMRESRQISHRLSLAITEEEDALYWEQYRKVLKRWQTLEVPEGIRPGKNALPQKQVHWKPVLNDAYIELTTRLKALYAARSKATTAQGRHAIESEIKLLKQKRSAATSYVKRTW